MALDDKELEDEEDDADPEFGDAKLSSQEDYAKKIHAPDDYGHIADRKPASAPDEEDADDGEYNPEKEASSADLEGKAIAAAPPKAVSPVDRYQQFMDEYKRLQGNRSKSDLVAGLMAAGGQIGQAMAGKYSGQFTPDMSGVNLVQKMGERPVQDFEQGQIVQGRQLGLKSSMDSADPASAKSGLVRDYLNKRLGMSLPETVSADDAMLLMKTMGKPQNTKFSQLPVTNQNTGEKTMAIFNPTTGTFSSTDGKPMGPEWVRDYRSQSFVDPATQERVGFSGGTGKVTGPLTGPGVNRAAAPEAEEGESVELSRPMLTAQQSKQLDHARDKFMNEVKGDRAAINSADRVLQVLQSGQSLGDLPSEEQDQMSRAFGQTGHITDSQMGRTLGRADWKSRLNLAKSMFFEGKIDDENRQFLMEVMGTIRDQNQQFVANKAKAHAANLANDFKTAPNLAKANVTPQSIMKMLAVEEAAASSSQQQTRQLIDLRDGKLKPIKADKYDDALKAKDADGNPLFEVPPEQK